jgi:hypothetical protein
VTEFTTKLRHHCRNPKCRMKLPAPVSNEHEAFCTPGCYRSFHLKRCGVCEKPLERRYQKRKRGDVTKYVRIEPNEPTACADPGCKRQWREGDALGRFWPKPHGGSQKTRHHQEVPAKGPVLGSVRESKNAKRWVLVAGSGLTPNQLHCATVTDGPDCQWEGGEFERIEAKNRRALEAHFAKLKAAETGEDRNQRLLHRAEVARGRQS